MILVICEIICIMRDMTFAEQNGFNHKKLAQVIEKLEKKGDAEKLGIGRQHLWQLKTGLRLPSVQLLARLKRVTRISVDSLFFS